MVRILIRAGGYMAAHPSTITAYAITTHVLVLIPGSYSIRAAVTALAVTADRAVVRLTPCRLA